MTDWGAVLHEIGRYVGIASFLGGFYGWGFISIFFHEAGHAIMAYFVGFAPHSIEIGSGKGIRTHFQFRQLNILIKEKPFGGATRYQFSFKKGIWWKGALVSLSGLFVDTVMLIPLSILALVSTAFNNRILSMMAVAPLISQIFQILYNLPPRNIKRDGRKIPNDTKLFWHYLTGKYGKTIKKSVEEFKKIIIRYDQSYHTATPWFVNTDNNCFSQYLEAAKDLKAQQYDAAISKYKNVLDSGLLANAEKAYILDTMASLPTIYGKKEYVNEALTWAEEALQLAPSAQTLHGSYGSLLIEAGQLEQGIQMLQPLTKEGNDALDQAISAYYLAKAYDALGNPESARYWLQKGKGIGNPHGIGERIEKELTIALNADQNRAM